MQRYAPGTQDPKREQELIEAVAATYYKPIDFVYAMWPWGEEGGPLEHDPGLDDWQVEVLEALGNGLLTVDEAIQIAVSSGHGIGKTALIAFIIIWYMATRTNPQVVVTSNTATQLMTKTWRELAKWWKLCRLQHWFKWTATRFYMVANPETWFAAAVPWTKERSEAFAGTHDKNVLVIFDEGSRIDDVIWEVAEGAMTTSGAVWVVFGNPTRNTGRFRECFRKFRKRWLTFTVDSRTARMTNKDKIAAWIADYGVDSDFVRVRVRGVFPRSGTNQLIPSDLIYEAQQRKVEPQDGVPRIMGVDPARFGDDQSVVYIRQGLATLGIAKFRGLDGVQLANRVAQIAIDHSIDAIFVDEPGLGASCCDQLTRLGVDFTPCNNSHKAIDEKQFHNHRAEMWWKTMLWLKRGGAIPADDTELGEDLEAPEYGYDNSDRVQLEHKDDIKLRIGRSPDTGDALALTFAHPVAPRIKTNAHRDRESAGTSFMAH